MATIKELIVKISSNAKDAIKDIKNYGKGVKDAGKDADNASDDVEELNKTIKQTGTEAQEAGEKTKTAAENISKFGTSSKQAKENTLELTDKVKGMVAPLEDVKTAMSTVTGILGAFGISVGVSQLIDQIKKVQEEADIAREKIIDMHQTMTYQYNLTADQKQIVANLASTANGGVGYAGNAEDLTKIVGSVANLNAGASLEEIQNLAQTYMYLSERGIGSLDGTVKEANILFSQFGVAIGDQGLKLEYLNSVASKSLIPLDTLITMMQDAQPIAEKFGLSFEEMASVIGESTLKDAGSTKQIQNFINGFSGACEKAVSEMAADDAEAYIRQYSESMLSLVNTGKYALSPLDMSGNVVYANRGDEDWKAARENSQLLSKYNSKSVEGTKPYYTEKVGEMGSTGTIPMFIDVNALEESVNTSTGLLDKVLQNGTTPVNDSLSLLNGHVETNLDLSTQLSDYTTETTIPTMGNEKTSVDNLTTSYIALANAKKAAKDA